jgi:low temperature requirement protein LtrA
VSEQAQGKRVAWVELYLVLIYALAIGQLAHLIIGEPEMDTVWAALGLFAVLWWTWIGFAVQYNRQGDDHVPERLLFLAGSIPTGVAAVAIEPAADGDIAAFAIAMATVRVLLAASRALEGGWRPALRMGVTRAYGLSAVLFIVSIPIEGPIRYGLWAIGVIIESRALLTENRAAVRALRKREDLSVVARDDTASALDPHHFAERFGLLLIILIGEVVIAAGETTAELHITTAAGWAALVAAMVLAATLWWLYFDSAVEINLRVLELSGGSPTVARALFAVGHMAPAFALLLIASAVGLLLDGHDPGLGYWLCSSGLGIYLIGTRVFFAVASRAGHVVRVVVVIATFELGWLEDVVSPHTFLWIVAAWAMGCAALSSWRRPAPVDDQLSGYV